MTTGLIIIARMGSTRLPGKHLLPSGYKNYCCTEILWKRLSTLELPIILATGESETDDPLVTFYRDKNHVFRGFDRSVPRRILSAGREQGWDSAIALDGDDLLVSLEGVLSVYKELESGCQLTGTTGLPFGMNSWGFSLDLLESSLANIENKTIETGWGRVFKHTVELISNKKFENDELLRFSLDYSEDLLFFKEIFKSLKDPITASTNEIVELVNVKEVYKINESVIEKYWENFNKEKNAELNS